MWKIWAIKSFSNCVDDRSKKRVYQNWGWCELTLCAISFSSTRRTPWLFTWSTALEKWLGGLVWRAAPLHFCRSPSFRSNVCHCQEDRVGVSAWTYLWVNRDFSWLLPFPWLGLITIADSSQCSQDAHYWWKKNPGKVLVFFALVDQSTMTCKLERQEHFARNLGHTPDWWWHCNLPMPGAGIISGINASGLVTCPAALMAARSSELSAQARRIAGFASGTSCTMYLRDIFANQDINDRLKSGLYLNCVTTP